MNACCPLNYLIKMVRARGLEPPRLAATDPKSAASAIPPRPLENKKMVTHVGLEPTTP